MINIESRIYMLERLVRMLLKGKKVLLGTGEIVYVIESRGAWIVGDLTGTDVTFEIDDVVEILQ